jgi:predicted RNA binding protein YcfA (HicA-like mRNA interferase family)
LGRPPNFLLVTQHKGCIMNSKEVIKVLQREGWIIDRTTKHCIMKKYRKIVPIPIHGNKDLPIDTLKSIERMTGVKLK